MSTCDRKVRKLRGHVSHGHGRVGKHRKHSGGRGKCGGMTHMKTLFDKYHPTHFGKRGMNIFHRKKNAEHCPTINVGSLWSLFPEKSLKEFQADEAKVPVLDLNEFGYFEVLGRGALFYKRPIVVKARHFTKQAEEKIKSVGGRCILSA